VIVKEKRVSVSCHLSKNSVVSMPMSTNDSPSSQIYNSHPARRGVIYQLQIVFGVAFLLATLFTVWTEPGLLPGNLTEKLNAALALQETTSPTLFPTQEPRARPVIGIVAGHSGNGEDVGAVCPDELGGIKEVDINMDIATRVRDKLVNDGYEVDLLAEFDPRLNGYQGMALISIHADSCQYIEGAKGFKIAAAMSTTYPEQATRLTSCLRERYSAITGMNFHAGSVTRDMTDYHAFYEINKNTPAAIIEVGFMNADREILIGKPDLLADGIVAGVLCYVLNEDISPSTTDAP
jgi:N-acetylmuramoyl-L-alanine amidase